MPVKHMNVNILLSHGLVGLRSAYWNNFNFFLKMNNMSAEPGAFQLSWSVWQKIRELSDEMPWPLQKVPLCRNNFNFLLKMKSMSAEPGAFQFSWLLSASLSSRRFMAEVKSACMAEVKSVRGTLHLGCRVLLH